MVESVCSSMGTCPAKRGNGARSGEEASFISQTCYNLEMEEELWDMTVKP